jgi:hypothetical protein
MTGVHMVHARFQSPVLLSSCDLAKQTYPSMKKLAETIPCMLADAGDTYYINSDFGQHNSIQHDACMLAYTPCQPIRVDSKH